MNDFIATKTRTPEVGRLVEVWRGEGNINKLIFDGKLWWMADGSMYVYYTPEYWRYV